MMIHLLRNQLWLFLGFSIAFLLLFLPVAASAVENASSTDTAASGTAETTAAADDDTDANEYEDIDIDENPATNWFSLQWRNIREPIQLLFTFDPVKKAEKAIAFAEERQIIAEKIIQESASPEALERAERVLERSESLAQRAGGRIENLLENPSQRATTLLRNLTIFSVRGEERLDRIEQQVPEEQLERFYQFRDRVTERAATINKRIEENQNIPEEVKERAASIRENLTERVEYRQEFREKLRAITDGGVSEDEKQDLQLLLQERKKQFTVNKEKVQQGVANVERIIEEKKQELEQAVLEGSEQAEMQLERLNKAEQRLEETKDRAQERAAVRKEQVLERRNERDERRASRNTTDDNSDESLSQEEVNTVE